MKTITKLLSALVLTAVTAGCADDDVYEGKTGGTYVKPESEYFDFNISRQVTFDLNYGEAAGSVLLQFYKENPVIYFSNSTFTVKENPVYKIFTDGHGRFQGTVDMLSAIETVYIYSPSWSVPTCVSAPIEDGRVTLDLTAQSAAAGAKGNGMATRADVTGYTVRTINEERGMYAYLTWGEYGKINECSLLNPEIPADVKGVDVSSDDLNAIQKLLWNGAESKPGNLNNSKYCVDTKHVNSTIAEYYADSDSVIHEVDSANIYFTFLTEWAWNQNTIGYYYYKSDNVPSSASGVKKFIFVPNASKPDHVPFGDSSGTGYGLPYFSNGNDAPMALNTHIQLLFEREDGTLTTDFPAGYTIGFFVMSDGYSTCNNSNTTNPGDNFDYGNIYYTNAEWNSNGTSSFIAMNSSNGVVYGMEDGSDNSYDDILFTIASNPLEAIQDPDRPTIDPTTDAVYTTETKTQIYAFEDIWPTGGDYDLNDVMIRHTRKITFNNVNSANNVTKVVDTFTPIQPEGSATKVDAFAVQYASDLRGDTLTLPYGAIDETETGSIILFSDAKEVMNQEFTVTRAFAGNNIQKSQIEADNLNPYIIADYSPDSIMSRTEVHLPKHAATSRANAEQINSGDDAYYTNKEGNHPFAISLTGDFTPVTETISIEVEYPDFTKWVESGGTEYTDWYENYVKYVKTESTESTGQ